MMWEIDPSHSSLEFAVRHMLVSTVKGSFVEFAADVEIDDVDLTKSRGTITAKVASLDTHEPRRDAHLRSADFFDVERFPTLTYVVKSIVQVGPDRFRIAGDLTIKAITREVPLEAEMRGPVADPFGKLRLGLTADGRINRHEFGLDWNRVTEAGGLLVGDEVKLIMEAEFVQVQVQ